MCHHALHLRSSAFTTLASLLALAAVLAADRSAAAQPASQEAGPTLETSGAPRAEASEPPSAQSTGEAATDQGPPPAVSYVVSRADTVGCIAARFGVSLEALRQANRGINPDRIRPGQKLAIPARHSDSLRSAPPRHEVAPQETFFTIAQELGVSVEDLRSWNPDVDPDSLRPGQELVLRRSSRVEHVVVADETVSEIAQRYGVSVQDIVGWNPGLDPDRVAAGQALVVRPSQPPSESLGSPTCGSLVNGRQLPDHPAYVIRNPERAFATEETVEHLRAAFDAVLRDHPEANRVRVHDLSLPEGGPIDDHRSHQSGRDVDIIYYQRDCDGGVCPLQPVLPRQLALGPQWTLLEHWLRNGQVQRVFIDYGLQEVLYNWARRHGATRSELEEWFQYPRGSRADVGIIRHFPNHFDHLHVRFRCPGDDTACQ